MHYAAIVIGDDVDAIMDPYNENKHTTAITDKYGDTYDHNPEGFWDWFEIGGRWSGELLLKDGGRTNSALRKDLAGYAIDSGPFHVITPEGHFARRKWDGDEWVEAPDHSERWRKVWENLPPNVRITIVDYHS